MKRLQRYAFPIEILLALSSTLCAQPSVRSVVNGASFSDILAPGTWVTIFGDRLAGRDATAASIPLAGRLNGVDVTIGGVPAPLLSVSANQINALVPFEIVTLSVTQQASFPLIVVTPEGTSSPFTVRLSRAAPALFTQNGAGTGNALAFDAGLNPLSRLAAVPLFSTRRDLDPQIRRLRPPWAALLQNR